MTKGSQVRIVLALAVLVLLGVLGYLSFSRTPKLAVIPSGDVPAVALQYVEGKSGIDNVVWRACYAQDDYVVSVNTHDNVSRVAPITNHYVQWIVCRDTGLGSEVVLTSTLGETGDRYAWRNDTRTAAAFADTITFAVGWAHEERAHTVVGTTALHGRLVEAAVVNGFWLLLEAERQWPEVFKEVAVKDIYGNVIHSY